MLFNTFGLPAIESCPGATASCAAVCYAARLEASWSTLATQMQRNWDALKQCGADVGAMEALISEMIGEFVADATKLASKGRRPLEDLLIFRIHWDGDFYSMPYAKAWARVIASYPDVAFWTYTRSFTTKVNVVPVLATLPNLVLYLSIDKDNAKRASTILKRYPTAKAAVMVDRWDQGLSALRKVGRETAPRCPELTGRTPLVTTLSRRGELELGGDGQGACSACGLCVEGRRDVVFATGKE